MRLASLLALVLLCGCAFPAPAEVRTLAAWLSVPCHARGALPDPRCTPGAVMTVSTSKVCVPGYSRRVRDVPPALKDRVYAQYGIRNHEPGEYEIDHLIPLSLGGSNDFQNLWPQPAEPSPGYHEKDAVESRVYAQVCKYRRTLQSAQRAMAADWTKEMR